MGIGRASSRSRGMRIDFSKNKGGIFRFETISGHIGIRGFGEKGGFSKRRGGNEGRVRKVRGKLEVWRRLIEEKGKLRIDRKSVV